jgi:hypothetical protein
MARRFKIQKWFKGNVIRDMFWYKGYLHSASEAELKKGFSSSTLWVQGTRLADGSTY